MTDDSHAERIAELEADNRRMRRLLDQKDAPGELRHRLRSTLALLRAVVRKSADTERDLAGYVAHLEDRLDAIARAQGFADQYGEVDLQTLLADELLHYGAVEGDRLLLSGPHVRLQPRAGQVLALAFHELAVNAVEHGALGAGDGQIEVSWKVADTGTGKLLDLTWTEQGPAPDSGPPGTGQPGTGQPGTGPARRGFGTEVLTHMLAYDLKAETVIAFGTDRVQCTIRLPLPEQVGRVVAG